MKSYYKLVRDKVPELIRNSGLEPRFRYLEEDEYRTVLREKLVEEAMEFAESGSREELVDLWEVFQANLKDAGISPDTLARLALEKRNNRGGFEHRVFLETVASPEELEESPNYRDWHNILFHGRNSATYKFAFAEALLYFAKIRKTTVPPSALALPYANAVCLHLKRFDRQSTGKSSSFLEACRRYNAGEITEDRLVEATIAYGFQYVIDAFHIVSSSSVPTCFYQKIGNSNRGGIRLTGALFALVDARSFDQLYQEIESRWHTVELRWAKR